MDIGKTIVNFLPVIFLCFFAYLEPDMILMHESFHAMMMRKFDPGNKTQIVITRKTTRFSPIAEWADKNFNIVLDPMADGPVTYFEYDYKNVTDNQIRLIALPGYLEQLARNLVTFGLLYWALARLMSFYGIRTTEFGIIYFAAMLMWIHIRYLLNKESDLHYVIHPKDCREGEDNG